MSQITDIEFLKREIESLKQKQKIMNDTLEFIKSELDNIIWGSEIDEKLDPVKKELEELYYVVHGK